MKTFLTSCVAIFAFFFLLSPSISSAETISLSPATVISTEYLAVQHTFDVNWTAPVGHSETDWVGIFAETGVRHR
jgi:hypothetical protein